MRKKIVCIALLCFLCLTFFSACDRKNTESNVCNHICEWKTTTPPTCDTIGIKSYQCKICNDIIYNEETSALGHDLAKRFTKNVTCTSSGERETYCSRCNYSQIEIIEAHGHSYVECFTFENDTIFFNFKCLWEDCQFNKQIIKGAEFNFNNEKLYYDDYDEVISTIDYYISTPMGNTPITKAPYYKIVSGLTNDNKNKICIIETTDYPSYGYPEVYKTYNDKKRKFTHNGGTVIFECEYSIQNNIFNILDNTIEQDYPSLG